MDGWKRTLAPMKKKTSPYGGERKGTVIRSLTKWTCSRERQRARSQWKEGKVGMTSRDSVKQMSVDKGTTNQEYTVV